MATFAHTLLQAAVGNAPASDLLTQAATSTSSLSATSGIAYANASSTLLSYPARLSIPAIGIDAAIQKVGLTAKGAIASPTNFTDAGWYKFSTLPGKQGSAILDGHVDNGLGLSGIFKHLSDVQKGEDIYVTTGNGTKLDFVVTSVDSYDYQHVPLETIMQLDDSARISLITCEGSWVSDQRTYNERLVVSAVLRNTGY